MKAADGRMGWKEEAPFDCIHVGAGQDYCVTLAADEVPKELVDQLANGGRMLVPVQNDFMVIDKDAQGKVSMKSVLGVVTRKFTKAIRAFDIKRSSIERLLMNFQ